MGEIVNEEAGESDEEGSDFELLIIICSALFKLNLSLLAVHEQIVAFVC